MGGNPLTDFAIRQSLEQFVETVWENGLFLQEFLNNKINERQIIIGDWANITPADTDSVKYERAISAMHPLPISLPWLPMAVHSSNIQTIEYNRSLSRLLIVEISTIKGIPFVDPCLVTEWNVVETSASTCHAYITLRFQYETSSSWLKSMVESNSTAELIKFFENWEIYYAEKLQKIKENDEIEMSPGLHQLAHLLPVMSTQSVSHGDDAKLESESLEKLPAISSEVNLGLSPSTVYSDSLVMTRESVLSNSTQDLAQNGSSTYRAESVDKLASLVRPDLAVEHLTVNVNIARNTNENEKEASSSASPINDINILKVCLGGLQSNCRIKFAATIVINLYAKIDVAALHGIKVTDAFR